MLSVCFIPNPVLCKHSLIVWWLKIGVVRVHKMNSWLKLQKTLESTATLMQYNNHALQAIFFGIALAAVLQLVQNF